MLRRRCEDAAAGSSSPKKCMLLSSSENEIEELHSEDSSNLQNENDKEDRSLEASDRSREVVDVLGVQLESSDVSNGKFTTNSRNIETRNSVPLQSNRGAVSDPSFQNQDAFHKSNQSQSLSYVFSNNQYSAVQPLLSYICVNGAQIPYSPICFNGAYAPHGLLLGMNNFQLPSNVIHDGLLRSNLSSFARNFNNASSVPIHLMGSQFHSYNSNSVHNVSSFEMSGRVLPGHIHDHFAQDSLSRVAAKDGQVSSLHYNANNDLISGKSINNETVARNLLPERIETRFENCSTSTVNEAIRGESSCTVVPNVNVEAQQTGATTSQSGNEVPSSESSVHVDPVSVNLKASSHQATQRQQNLDSNLVNDSRDNVSFHASPNIQNDNARLFSHSSMNNSPHQNNSTILNSGNINLNNLSTRLAQALESSLGASRADSSRLYTRISASRNALQFTGDPLDWPRFKQAFLVETQVGDYSEAENVIRLYGMLKGEALNETKSLFATGHTCEQILKALEMRFGCPKIIVHKVVSEIRDLPSLETGKVDLIEFASKLKNSVAAIKALNEIGHLYSPDLAKETLRKLPSSMLSNYINVAMSLGREKSDLEKISIFLYKEAEAAIEAGIFDIFSERGTKKESINSPQIRKNSLKNSKVHVFATKEYEKESKLKNENAANDNFCLFCKRKNHLLHQCRDILRESVKERWRIVKSNKLCYNCLKIDHTRMECKSVNGCSHCGRRHHSILHFNLKSSSQTETIKIKEKVRVFQQHPQWLKSSTEMILF